MGFMYKIGDHKLGEVGLPWWADYQKGGKAA